MSEKKQEIPVEIPLEEILKDFEKFQRIKDALEKNENPFKDREQKKYGGSAGSLMDQPLNMQTVPTVRYLYNEGGSVRENTIGFYLSLIHSSPRTADMHPFLIEAYDWLDNNLTPAEKRQFGFIKEE